MNEETKIKIREMRNAGLTYAEIARLTKYSVGSVRLACFPEKLEEIKRWKKENRDKVAGYAKKYYEKHKEELIEKSKKYYYSHRYQVTIHRAKYHLKQLKSEDVIRILKELGYNCVKGD